jgi:hypothetical protein
MKVDNFDRGPLTEIIGRSKEPPDQTNRHAQRGSDPKNGLHLGAKAQELDGVCILPNGHKAHVMCVRSGLNGQSDDDDPDKLSDLAQPHPQDRSTGKRHQSHCCQSDTRQHQ